MRAKKCKICKEQFTPVRNLQLVCSPKCGFEYVEFQKRKQWQKRKKELKEKLLTRTDYLNLLQRAFNAYIRS